MPFNDSAITLISWWGAGLSTLLALIKLGELWRDRFRLEVGHGFSGSVEIGNEVFVRNLAGRPLILTYWELLYCSGRRPFRRFSPLQNAEPDDGEHVIAPHSTFTLRFSDAYYFDWGADALKGKAIFIRLYFAGRSPILRKVYQQ